MVHNRQGGVIMGGNQFHALCKQTFVTIHLPLVNCDLYMFVHVPVSIVVTVGNQDVYIIHLRRFTFSNIAFR